MNDELEKGDILYYITKEKFVIFEVEKVEETFVHIDRYIRVSVIDRITSTKYEGMTFPANIKLMDYYCTGYGVFTTHENVALNFFENQNFIDFSWLFNR